MLEPCEGAIADMSRQTLGVRPGPGPRRASSGPTGRGLTLQCGGSPSSVRRRPLREPFLFRTDSRAERRPGGRPQGRSEGRDREGPQRTARAFAASSLVPFPSRPPVIIGTEAHGFFIFCYRNFHTQKQQNKEAPYPASAVANHLPISFHFPVFWGRGGDGAWSSESKP